MVVYKLKFYSIKRKKFEIKEFNNFEDFSKLYHALLGHTYIKELAAYKYDKNSSRYKEYMPV